jgi:hypothetical protein
MLEIHHRDEDESNNDPANLMTVCYKCHSKFPTHLFSESFDCKTTGNGDGRSICLRLGQAAGDLGPKNCPYYTKEHGCILESRKVPPGRNLPDQDLSRWTGWTDFIKAGQATKVLPVEIATKNDSETSGKVLGQGGDDDENDGAKTLPWFVRSKSGWEKWWWKKPNKFCAKCINSCKQSWRARVIKCPQFEAKC